MEETEYNEYTALFCAAWDVFLRSGADPLDPRRRLEKISPDIAISLTAILQVPPASAVPQLAALANSTIRPETRGMDWLSFDRVMATMQAMSPIP
jgi:hypothetical protein